MADKSQIEWTEATWNPITGCSRISPGCGGPGPHGGCYAEQLAGTRLKHHPSREGLTKPTPNGPRWTGEVRLNAEWLDQPLRWTRPRMIFVCAHGDLFHEKVSDEWIDQVFAVMALCPQHTFQVLTKRADRMREYCRNEDVIYRIDTEMDFLINERIDPLARHSKDLRATAPLIEDCWPMPNVWLGVSVEDQQRADQRIRPLLETPAAVRWISAEPLLGPIDLGKVFVSSDADGIYLNDAAILGLDWLVVGGESGPRARPMHPEWARRLRDQCQLAGVPFFFKQWGEWLVATHDSSKEDLDLILSTNPIAFDGAMGARLGKKKAGALLDGVEHKAMPLTREEALKQIVREAAE